MPLLPFTNERDSLKESDLQQKDFKHFWAFLENPFEI